MAQAPATPAYIFRGHISPIHALRFFVSNLFLASGDSDGWLVIWNLSTKRAVAAWKAHGGGIMEIKDWDTRLVTHGRDHRLRVWQIHPEDVAILSTKLPVDGITEEEAPQPWLLHSFAVHALNFCAFAMCDAPPEPKPTGSVAGSARLIAAPNGLDSGGVDIFHLPSEQRVSQLRSDQEVQTGMVMALALFHRHDSLVLASGYEDGHIMVHCFAGDTHQWLKTASSQPHTQPVLSLDLSPSNDYFISSSADAILAKFSLSAAAEPQTGSSSNTELEKSTNTKHAGQQGLKIRSDGRIFATAGWDQRVRVYSTKTLKELAVLKWHTDGCYAIAFATIHVDDEVKQSTPPGQSREIGLRGTALDVIKHGRTMKAQQTHWLAAGAKDGKISLWDIY